jgi:hypothetical protein
MILINEPGLLGHERLHLFDKSTKSSIRSANQILLKRLQKTNSQHIEATRSHAKARRWSQITVLEAAEVYNQFFQYQIRVSQS